MISLPIPRIPLGSHIRLTLLAGLTLCLSPALKALTKVYIFAGQSNMAGNLTHGDLEAEFPEIDDWLNRQNGATREDISYYYWRGYDYEKIDGVKTIVGEDTSDGWTELAPDISGRPGQEHMAAYRLYNYWKMRDPSVDIAIIKICQGATSLNGFWTAGGRDRSPWEQMDGILHFTRGLGNVALHTRITDALQKLEDQDIDYEVCAFFWYQGEGDSNTFTGADNYQLLFQDMVHGWTERSAWPEDIHPTKSTYNDPPQDDIGQYAGSVRELLGLDHLPTFTALISTQLKGSSAWGRRTYEEDPLSDDEPWGLSLNKVREAFMNYSSEHQPSGWITVDDIALHDYYHYEGKEYFEIGDRMVQAYFDTIHNQDFPRVEILAPSAFGEILNSETTINLEGRVFDNQGNPVSAGVRWISSEDGVIATDSLTHAYTPTSWEERPATFGSANEYEEAGFHFRDNPAALDDPDNPWDVVIQKMIKITLEYTDAQGNVHSATRWIKQKEDTDANGLSDEWEGAYNWPGGHSGGAQFDADGDGRSNLQEWLSGTNPTAPDAFNIRIRRSSSNVQLNWSAAPNRTHRLFCAPGLPVMTHPEVIELAAFSPLATQAVSLQDDLTGQVNRFYQLIVTP